MTHQNLTSGNCFEHALRKASALSYTNLFFGNFLPRITVPFDFLPGISDTKLPGIASNTCWIILLCK